jgi:hypothetical protein
MGVAGHPHVAQMSATPRSFFFFFLGKKNTLKIKKKNLFFQYIPLWFFTFHDMLHVVLQMVFYTQIIFGIFGMPVLNQK